METVNFAKNPAPRKCLASGRIYSSLEAMPTAVLEQNLVALLVEMKRRGTTVEDFHLDCLLVWRKELTRRSAILAGLPGGSLPVS